MFEFCLAEAGGGPAAGALRHREGVEGDGRRLQPDVFVLPTDKTRNKADLSKVLGWGAPREGEVTELHWSTLPNHSDVSILKPTGLFSKQ